MNRSRIVWLSTAAPAPSSNEKRGSRSVDRLPRSPLQRIRSLALRGRPSGGAARSAASGAVPLPLRVIDQLAALHRRVVGELLGDALQIVRALLQLVGAEA